MNKKQKTEKCREILYKYPLFENIKEENDICFLLSIFENHSEWDLKQGNGILSISTTNNLYKTRCFQLNRIDGSFTDISYTHCLNKKSIRSNVIKACRNSIRGEIVKFRNENVKFGITICQFTNEILLKENTHIDHYDLTFNEMFNLWIANYNLDFLNTKINETVDNSFETYFTDKLIIEDFIKFHNNNTKLRAVSKNANLSIIKILNNKL